MRTDFIKTSGVGRNVRYDISRDGEVVGAIHRHGEWTVVITGHFGERLETCANFDEAKSKAMTLAFPSREETHERVCQRVAESRLRWLEQSNGSTIASLSRRMLDGDALARTSLRELLDAITALAGDRSHSTRRPENSRSPNWATEYLLDRPVRWEGPMEREFPSL